MWSICASGSPTGPTRRRPPGPGVADTGHARPESVVARGGAYHHGDQGHGHGLIDRSITRSREGLSAVGMSLGVLLVTSLLQGVIFVATGSVALLADLIHNLGDALTAIPLDLRQRLRRGGDGGRSPDPSGVGDPIIGLVIALVTLRITWQSIQTIRADPGPPGDAPNVTDL